MGIIFRFTPIILYLCLGVRINYPIQRGYIDLPASNNSKVNKFKVNKMQEEIWKPVKGLEDYFEVSSLGRLNRKRRERIGSKGRVCVTKEMLLSINCTVRGYRTINFTIKGLKIPRKYIHKLVAESFLGHKPCGMKEVINHIDGNKLNNSVDNLEVTTQRINSYKHYERNNKKCTSKYVGVYWSKNAKKWATSTKINGVKIHLGYHNTELEAHQVYQNKIKEINYGVIS